MKAIICDMCGKVLKTKKEIAEAVNLQLTAEGCRNAYLTAQLCDACGWKISQMVEGERTNEEAELLGE